MCAVKETDTIRLLCEIVEKQNSIIREQADVIAQLGGAALEEEICQVNRLVQNELGL